MSDFLFAFLVLIALAAVGNFAGDPSAYTGHCVGSWFNICW